MAGHGKKYRNAYNKIDVNKLYPVSEAMALAKETSYAKFDANVDLAINLGVDPRQADQNVRGSVVLPNGSGKKVRIVVFAKGEKLNEAQNAGVEFAGGEDLAQKITGGWMDFDQVVATPDMMGVVGKLGKVLGPRGLMPNPKIGTVTFDLSKTIKELKAGRAEYRVDKAGIVHVSIGKASFEPTKLEENAKTVIEAIVKAKPSTAKGTYLKKICASATMGPGIKIDPTPFRL